MSDLILFKRDVENFLAVTGMAPSKFGADACNDRPFVMDLRSGREPRTSTMREVREFMTGWLAEHPECAARLEQLPADIDGHRSSEVAA